MSAGGSVCQWTVSPADIMSGMKWLSFILVLPAMFGQTTYDLLLKGGHVIDGKNKISAVMDVAIADGKIAAVASDIPAAKAAKVVDLAGLYVTPGLVDMHVHVYAGTGQRGAYCGDN